MKKRKQKYKKMKYDPSVFYEMNPIVWVTLEQAKKLYPSK